jgi:aminoglycoside phosphotransferase (APT) family kinase protein
MVSSSGFDRERLSAEWQRAFAWIEAQLGGAIVGAERQARWRPAWFLDLERNGEIVPLYFRGERGEARDEGRALAREAGVFRVLEANDIPVPHIYGLCPEPRGIVMDRCPGRANLATAESEAERRAVLDHYVELLVRMHRLDVAAFEPVGLSHPEGPEASALLDFEIWEQGFRQAKQRPEPAIEFLIGWVRRNLPRDRERVSFVCGDSGQFLFERGRVSAVLDLELACLGDPAADLGGLISRDLSEPLGDLSHAVRRYEELSGEPIDRRVVDFHAVRFCLVTPLAVANLVAAPPPGLDFIQYLGWCLVWTRAPLEVIAGRMGLELEAPPLPDELQSPEAEPGESPAGDDFEAYQADSARRVAIYRERCESLGPQLEADDLAEVAALTGQLHSERVEADRALEALVREADSGREAELIRYLHRRELRDEALLRPVMRELQDACVQLID